MERGEGKKRDVGGLGRGSREGGVRGDAGKKTMHTPHGNLDVTQENLDVAHENLKTHPRKSGYHPQKSEHTPTTI